MSNLYTLTSAGAVPVSVDDMKTYLKLTSASDDALLTTMLSSATSWGERYTGRDFRANTWTLLTDEFADRICLDRSPVASITSVKYLVLSVFTAVASSVYYLKKSLQFSEILLNEDESWPTDIDNREQGVEIVFVTASYHDTDTIALAIKKHVAHWYRNRGDCADAEDAAKKAGVDLLYDQFRIVRV